ncbi:MAG: DNA-binding protein [Bryobacterales bacterium]|nr:DNA-binding protein [Bryobacterales bacterium]
MSIPAELSETHVTNRQIADALGITANAVHMRADAQGWPYRKAGRYRGGPRRFYPVSALPADVRQALADRGDPAALLRAAAGELLERLEVSTEELQDYRDCIRESSTAPDGVYSSCDDEQAVRELDEVIAANRAAMARARGGDA